jgi:gliding motility-associated-like protein
VDFSNWEWIDLNGDDRFDGPENEGELNKAGFGSKAFNNIQITGPNGYARTVFVGITGNWRTRPSEADPYGLYTVTLVMDEGMAENGVILAESGLVKTIPTGTRHIRQDKFNAEYECSPTNSPLSDELTAINSVLLDFDFGVICFEIYEIIATDDNFSGTPIIEMNGGTTANVLTNDTMAGLPVVLTDINLTLVSNGGITGLVLNSDGTITVPAVTPTADYTITYQICQQTVPTNCDEATVVIRVISGDADDDGILDDDEDRNEDGNFENDDCDLDGIPDYLDPTPCIELKTQKVITPNGDDLNQFMKIVDIEKYPDAKVSIFNRWGNLVWEVKGYDNHTSSKRFEGNSNVRSNGPLPDGTYYYVIELGQGQAPIKNFVMIKR